MGGFVCGFIFSGFLCSCPVSVVGVINELQGDFVSVSSGEKL